jgi:hypothetical protein
MRGFWTIATCGLGIGQSQLWRTIFCIPNIDEIKAEKRGQQKVISGWCQKIAVASTRLVFVR